MENKTSKYFKYAIGEIVLVVIGILIALQINTWNENSKLRKLETETLSEIKEALVQDTIVINTNLKVISNKIEGADILIGHIKSKQPYESKLDTLMMEVYYHKGYNTFNTTAFELLKERGFGIVKNKALRKLITHHYTSDIADTRSILARLDKINMIQGERMYENFLIENSIIKPYDYEELINNPKTLGPFTHFQTMNGGYFTSLKEFKEKTTIVLNAVGVELEKRDAND